MKPSFKGHLLIASQNLVDPNFAQGVVLLLEHNDEGAAGLVLNRPIEQTVEDVWKEMFDRDIGWAKPLGVGGPVPGPLTVIHEQPSLADVEVVEGVYTSLSPEKIQELVDRRAEPSLFLANYAGWGPGQLEGEIKVESWHLLPARAEHIFWNSEQPLWNAVLAELNYQILGSQAKIGPLPSDPSVN